MRKILIIFFLAINLFGCKAVDKNISNLNEKAEKVSLISVIANPEKYHKKNIIVEGYFIMETEGNAIYVSKADYSNMLNKNAVYLFTDFDFLKKMGIEAPYRGYVSIEGIFNKDIKGSYDFYSGTFEEVKNISRMYKRGSVNDELNMD